MIINSTGLDMSYIGSSAQGLDGMGPGSLLVLAGTTEVWWSQARCGSGLVTAGLHQAFGGSHEV